MLKKNLALILILTIIFLTGFNLRREKTPATSKTPPIINRNLETANKILIQSESIFVPYWSLNNGQSDPKNYERAIYFGVVANKQGIDEEDMGYKSLPAFNISFDKTRERYLTLIMTDTDVNIDILKDRNIQNKIIDQTNETAKSYAFDGIVLDFELPPLLSDKIPSQLNNFVSNFYSKSKEKNLNLSLTIFGDTFYRKRPYDVNFLSKNSDEIIIMAYDFHKSRGEPGANFPLIEFKNMINQFLSIVPKEKLTVALGMYGYDWLVDEKKRPIKPAKALTLNEIRKKFSFDSAQDKPTAKGESETSYKDSDGQHILWFEDEKSVEVKINYLKEKGVGEIAYWAWGYF